MGYGHIALRIFAPAVNLFTGAVNLVIRRDRRVLLFGSWMGDRYADNSRFLYFPRSTISIRKGHTGISCRQNSTPMNIIGLAYPKLR